MASVLGDEMTSGITMSARDDLFVGGDTREEAITNWSRVLAKLEAANLKVTARKVKIFPRDTVVFGMRVSEGKISPSAHVIETLGEVKMEELKTNKQVNSWKGLYKTLAGHLPDLSSVKTKLDDKNPDYKPPTSMR